MQVTTERTLGHRSETEAIPVPDTKTSQHQKCQEEPLHTDDTTLPQADTASGGEAEPGPIAPQQKREPRVHTQPHCGPLLGSPYSGCAPTGTAGGTSRTDPGHLGI